MILDIGCGSGLSGSQSHLFFFSDCCNPIAHVHLIVSLHISEVLEEAGHVWVGTDIR